MSFSWKLNGIFGEVGNDPLTSAYVINNGPTRPLTGLTVPQEVAHSLIYEIPDYMRLGDMSADKSSLIMQRGGYSAENVNKQPAKLHCYEENASAKYYCEISKNYNAMLDANSPSH